MGTNALRPQLEFLELPDLLSLYEPNRLNAVIL